MTALNDRELTAHLNSLPAWRHDAERKALHRRLSFATFADALAAMVRIGIEADKADHHPEWTNVYDRLDIWLTTHDVNGVTVRDIALARAIDAMFPA
ncbi:4a-hydroxytetrahydrobiopterin dehydratase [Sphingomonas carotinifaciens]|uniref:Putative pterin-4-alpha-carbinolamine dehydratase n=1 Tax=Sphingomonas carotinifaciens TaxID=1166323 RepID=A0A1G7PYQ0_9SPHN|nr:4a-hydroxytetrahydrobiopterin dehydratase [Sphingomonas carotinifaciens]MBB4087566.1 4a-hydroxytetrahydrobiopterin dehydratase [Sphingomonas carotinifaciens]MWC45649.1 4a-hydroxytetrahydrobiopterin dehydratase [Sphingomonas carotinifaciens]SDF91457.1 4a-hydroxytetrahydrobiopterin dehydratase [Sphingomonas carotinifaciens]